MRAAQQVYSKIRGMAVASQLVYSKLQQYKPPSWASKLAYQPTEYVQVDLAIMHVTHTVMLVHSGLSKSSICM